MNVVTVVVRSAVGVAQLLGIRQGGKGRGENEGDDEAAHALDDVGGHAGKGAEAIEEILEAEVAGSDERR